MAITSTVNSDFKSLTGKTLTVQSVLSSQVQLAVIDVAIGAGDNYATNGLTVDLSADGRISTIIAASIVKDDTGCKLEYVPAAANAAATGKVKFRGVDPGAAGGAITSFPELPNASSVPNSKSIQFLVLGY